MNLRALRVVHLVLLLCCVHTQLAHAQQPPPSDEPQAVVRIAANVTAVSGGYVYLDRGRGALVEPGDLVEIRPLGSSPVPAIVRSVSRSSCRAELAPGVTGVGIADRAEILIPEARVAAAAADVSLQDGVPDHPPWTADEQGYDPNLPLLAPTWAKPAAELPMKVYGRFYTQWNGTWDEQFGNEYHYLRVGTDLTVENPYGAGGQLHVSADFSERMSMFGSGSDELSSRARINRASYSWGGTREQADRVEVGRFLQHAFPELGLLDGVEVAHPLAGGAVLGASFGAMPQPVADLSTGDDLQAAVFLASDPQRKDDTRYGIAYQNTWHLGEQDRNLLVGTLESELTEDVRLDADVLVDFYGAGDTIKTAGAEVTEARVYSTWRVDKDTGVGLFASHVRWPELKSAEFGDLTPQQVADDQVTRFGVSAWRNVTEALRVDGRADLWQDQDDAGSSGNVRASLRNVLWDRGDVSADLFVSSGAFTDGHGLRLAASRAFETIGYGRLSWELSEYSGTSLSIGSSNMVQQALRASLDTALWDRWNMSLYGERRFGDNQASNSIGLYLQRRF